MKEMAREIDGEAKRNVLMTKKMKTAASILRTKTNALMGTWETTASRGRKVSSQKSVIPQCKIQYVRQHSRAHSGFRSARYHWRARPNCA